MPTQGKFAAGSAAAVDVHRALQRTAETIFNTTDILRTKRPGIINEWAAASPAALELGVQATA
jgi:hypothetical protein